MAKIIPVRPDAELIAACAEFDALESQRAGVLHGPDAIVDEAARNKLFAFIQEMQKPTLDRVCSLRATTLEGYFARARTVLLEDLELHPAEMVESGSTNERLLGALLRDLVEQGTVGSAV
jgi:arginase family enzyme